MHEAKSMYALDRSIIQGHRNLCTEIPDSLMVSCIGVYEM